MVKIEKGIPIPEKLGRGERAPKYPWGDMEVGDSIYTETKNPPGVPKEFRDQGMKFRPAKEGEGWRMFRVE